MTFTVVAIAHLLIRGVLHTERYEGPDFVSAAACEAYRASGDNRASIEDLADVILARDEVRSVAIETRCETATKA